MKRVLASTSLQWSEVYGGRLTSALRYTALCIPVFLIPWMIFGDWLRASVYAAFIAGIGLAYLYSRKLPESVIPAWIYFSSVAGMIVAESMLTGLSRAPVLWSFPMIPMLGGHLLGSKKTIVLTLFSLAGICAIHLLESLGWEPPEVLHHSAEPIFVLIGITIGYCRIAFSSVRSLENNTQKINVEALEMIQSRLKADKAADAKKAFLANMSQQVMIPLHGAISDSQSLLESAPGREKEACLALDESVQRVWHVVNDIVDISRIESGSLMLDSTPLDLDLIVESVCMECAAPAQYARVVLDIEPFELRTDLMGDPKRLARMICILVQDALSVACSRVSLRIELSDLEPTTHRDVVCLQVRVRHDGRSEELETSQLVFGMHVDAEDRVAPPAIGLGIAMVEGLARAMDGSLNLCCSLDGNESEILVSAMLTTGRNRFSALQQAAA